MRCEDVRVIFRHQNVDQRAADEQDEADLKAPQKTLKKRPKR